MKKYVFKTMDGNEAAAYASYAFTEVAAIYPITPSSPMAELVDKWSAMGKKNIFGQRVKLVEMQSEGGAVSAVHGALDTGALASSYTASQGLMLMVPTMFRIAGELMPGVIHVASRNVATNAISINVEHSDVMACRQTGFAILASSSVQEAMDLAAVAHLSAIKGHVPFLHFFDGFRTSHEIQKVRCLDYGELAELTDRKELQRFRLRALNSENPYLRTTGQYADTYFQSREACNEYYNALPGIVAGYMDEMNARLGTSYRPYEYYGAPDAEHVLVGMGSLAGTAQETVDYLNARGEKAGYLNVHLYRPFSAEYFLRALPETVKSVTVGDRTKEPGAAGEPLFEDVSTVLLASGRNIRAYACRYGLAGKDVTPGQVLTMFRNMAAASPRRRYTIGIDDDVTHLSIPVLPEIDTAPSGMIQCKFWGLGSDGTVGANKNTIKIIGDHTDMQVQAFFEYDGKKSGGVTRSHLRFGNKPIRSSYLVHSADFIACSNKSYLNKYPILQDIREGGSVLIDCGWRGDELDKNLSAKFRLSAAEKKIHLYAIDAAAIAGRLGLGNRTNTILQAAFFRITGVIPAEDARQYMKEAIAETYGRKGDDVVRMNCAAVDAGMCEAEEIEMPEEWAALTEEAPVNSGDLPRFISNILIPVNSMTGNTIPVSEFLEWADGTMPQGSTKYEKRGIAVRVPVWDADKCIQCSRCSLVCPHSCIRPFLLTADESKAAPDSFASRPSMGRNKGIYRFSIQVSALDCVGCGSCAEVCPAREKALSMRPLDENIREADNWDYALKLSEKPNLEGTDTIKGTQFQQPLLEFPGACPGCGETPYAKLVTQLYGERMIIATATGCSQVWGTSFPAFPYTVNSKGRGPAVGGSLFENNAEYGLGMWLSTQQQRNRLLDKVEALRMISKDERLQKLAGDWVAAFDDGGRTVAASEALEDYLAACRPGAEEKPLVDAVLENRRHLVSKSIWMFGGDGWAYDIGYGGLDHVLASGADVNILVFDTEVYSNTGGQASKSTPAGAVAQFAADGKRRKKKDLGFMAMSYGNVYVAQVAMGADMGQCLKALKEAEAYKGTSLIIAYAPCINHGLRCGMSKVQDEIRRAVEVGYWQIYRYNPMLIKEHKNPFTLDSPAPKGNFRDFLMGEVRYSSLVKTFPDIADELLGKTETDAMARCARYKALAEKESV